MRGCNSMSLSAIKCAYRTEHDLHEHDGRAGAGVLRQVFGRRIRVQARSGPQGLAGSHAARSADDRTRVALPRYNRPSSRTPLTTRMSAVVLFPIMSSFDSELCCFRTQCLHVLFISSNQGGGRKVKDRGPVSPPWGLDGAHRSVGSAPCILAGYLEKAIL